MQKNYQGVAKGRGGEVNYTQQLQLHKKSFQVPLEFTGLKTWQ